MKKISIKAFVAFILIALGVVAVGLTIFSTYQFRASAIQSQSNTLSRVVEVASAEILGKMQELDPLFQQMFLKMAITGSVKKGLKVQKPNEFDVNIVLKLPIKDEDSQLIKVN